MKYTTVVEVTSLYVKFQVITAASMEMTIIFDIWNVAPCSLVEVYRCFRGACCLHHQRDDDGGCPDDEGNKHL
jgi:hypothetical protein